MGIAIRWIGVAASFGLERRARWPRFAYSLNLASLVLSAVVLVTVPVGLVLASLRLLGDTDAGAWWLGVLAGSLLSIPIAPIYVLTLVFSTDQQPKGQGPTTPTTGTPQPTASDATPGAPGFPLPSPSTGSVLAYVVSPADNSFVAVDTDFVEERASWCAVLAPPAAVATWKSGIDAAMRGTHPRDDYARMYALHALFELPGARCLYVAPRRPATEAKDRLAARTFWNLQGP